MIVLQETKKDIVLRSLARAIWASDAWINRYISMDCSKPLHWGSLHCTGTHLTHIALRCPLGI